MSSREITSSEKAYLLSLKPKEITFKLICDLFAHIEEGKKLANQTKLSKSKFNTNDKLTLTPNEYFVKQKTETTVGRLIYNKFIVEGLHLEKILGYVNWELTDSGVAKVDGILARALVNDAITVEDYAKYVDYRDWLGEISHFPLSCSFTMNILKTPKSVIDLKNKLFKENKDKIDAGDVRIAEKIEKDTLALARKELKDDPAMELYNSEARGSFNNNYKNINIMKGPVFNNITGKYDIVKESHMEGMSKNDISVFGNSIISGAYPKAVGTQVSGYFAKQILAALQTEMLDKKDSDCHTKRTIPITINNKNKKEFEYRYIKEGNKLVCLTPDIIDRYVDKKVQLRSPMSCCGKRICNKCAGELVYKTEIVNIGLAASRVANTLTKLGMKKFHDSTIHTKQIDIDNILI